MPGEFQGEIKLLFCEVFLFCEIFKAIMEKFQKIKELEYLVAFQVDCLTRGDWESFDKAENQIKKLEETIIENSEKSASASE